MKELRITIRIIAALLTVISGPYRVVAYKFRSFGGAFTGALTWAGILIVYPIPFLIRAREMSGWWVEFYGVRFLWVWAALFVAAWIQMFVQWCSNRGPRDAGKLHFWGGWFEPAFAFFLWKISSQLLPVGDFFLLAYASAVGRAWMIRLARRLDAWTPADTRRYAEAFRSAVSTIGGFLLRGGKAVLVKDVPAGTVRQPTFMGRVATFLAGHMVLSAIGGFIGIKLIAIPFAFFLWAMGWHVAAPSDVKEEARQFVGRAKDALGDAAEETTERLREKKRLLEEEIERRRPWWSR